MLRIHFIRVLVGFVLGTLAGAAFYTSSPKVYESTSQVYINASPMTRDQEALAGALALGVSQSVVSEAGILRSPQLFGQALERVAFSMGQPALASEESYNALLPMYDVEVSRDSRVVQITTRARDPKVAANLATEVVKAYNELRKQTSLQANSSAEKTLNNQLVAAAKGLRDAENKVRAFKEQNGIVDLSGKSAQVASYQSTLAQQMDAALQDQAMSLQEVAARTADMKARKPLVSLGFSTAQSPLVAQLENQGAEYERQRIELLQKYTPESKRIQEQNALIAANNKRLFDAQNQAWKQTSRSYTPDPIRLEMEQGIAMAQIKLASTKARIRSIEHVLEEQTAAIKTLPAKELALAQLTRDQAVFQSKYLGLKSTIEDLHLKNQTSIQQATVVFPADVPTAPTSPKASRFLPMGALMGACLAFLVSLARESLRSTVRTSSEISGLLELPVAATAPMLKGDAAARHLRGLANPKFAPNESFRFLASSTLLAGPHPKVVMFTSVGGGVGCSNSAGEFAVAVARMGAKTVLVDADLTFTTLTKVFDAKDKSGVREIVGKKLLPSAEEESLIVATPQPNLSLLPSGGDGPWLSEVPPEDLESMVAYLREQGQVIVIDAPPLDVLADASRFAPLVDEVHLVLSAQKTPLAAVMKAETLLARCGAKSVSLVLTGTLAKEEAFTRQSRYHLARRNGAA